MSLILVTSIVVRLAAMVWSIVLWRRVRDWRMGFLTATLALMSLRQLLSLRKVAERTGLSLDIPGDTTELPGLAVSVLAALATYFLAQIILERRTTRRILEEREAQLRQAQKMEAIGLLAGSVAHDFNNLLTIVFANVRLAAAGLPDDDPRHKRLAEIREAGNQGARLIRQLLAFARQQPVEKRPIDVGELVAELEGMLSRVVGDDVSLEVSQADAAYVVEADRSQLEQLVLNLVVNARDAMPKGGVVSLSVAGRSLSRADARDMEGARPGLYAVLSVEDTGQGMSTEVLERCFEPFFTTKGEGKGSGLGLSTCYGIAKQTGGFIHIDSQVGRGTVIAVYMPQLPPDSQAELLAKSGSQSQGRALVVGPDEATRSVVAGALKEQGFEVDEVLCGADAVAVARDAKESHRILISDTSLPDMRGEALAGELGASRPDMRVLLLASASSSTADIGEYPLLEKPFSQQAVGRRVRQMIGRRR